MNENSSRSHSVMTITLSSEMPDPEDPQGFIRKEGRFCLVDLAGSEKTKRTNSRGGTFVEANNINRSLLVLGNCIACLSDPKRRNGHIPYRDSTLTKLLADSLSGNGMTLMIACISPLKCDSQETISTLRYAMRAKRVRMNPVVQMDPRELLILSLKREVRLLRMENNYLRQNYHQMWTNSQQPPIEPVDMNALSNHSEIKAGEEDKDGQLLNKYMRENEVLRVENVQLNLQRNRLVRDHELVCRENEQLLKRLQSLMGKLNTTDGKQPLPINLQHNPALFSSASSPSIFSLVSDEDSKPSKARLNSFSHGLNEKPSQMMERIVDSEDDNGLILIREKQSRSSAKNSSATQSKNDHKNLDLTIRGKSAVSGARSTARRRN